MATCPACCVENPEGSRYLQRVWLLVPRRPDGRDVRKTVTVVFCDVTVSTALGERLDPEALCRVMLRYFDAMTGSTTTS